MRTLGPVPNCPKDVWNREGSLSDPGAPLCVYACVWVCTVCVLIHVHVCHGVIVHDRLCTNTCTCVLPPCTVYMCVCIMHASSWLLSLMHLRICSYAHLHIVNSRNQTRWACNGIWHNYYYWTLHCPAGNFEASQLRSQVGASSPQECCCFLCDYQLAK